MNFGNSQNPQSSQPMGANPLGGLGQGGGEVNPLAGGPAPGGGGGEAFKPWRPELQAMAPQDGLLPGGEMGPETQEFSDAEMAVVGGPSKWKASMSRANLVLFALFLAGVGVVAFMSLRKGPSEATAAQKQNDIKVHSAIDKFLKTAGQGETRSQSPDALMRDTRSLVDMFFNFTSKAQVPLEDLRTNPFCFAAEEGDGPNAKKESEATRKAAEIAEAKRLAEIKARFAKLKLQTVMSSLAGRQAMINDQVLRVGDTIDGFAVEDIQPRSVTLSCDGQSYKLEISF